MAVSSSSPIQIAYPIPHGNGGVFHLGAASGNMTAALAANSEIFQFRYATANGRIALIHRVTIQAGAMAAASAVGTSSFRLTMARAWTAKGTGGTRLNLTGNNAKVRSSMATSEIDDAGITTTGALVAGTKTLDAVDLSTVSVGLGTGAITTSVNRIILPEVQLFTTYSGGGHPIVLVNQEGFVVRVGNAFPAGMTWSFSVNVAWSEVPSF